MSLEFITCPRRWQQIYQSLPEFPGKIYYAFQYYQFYQANGDGTPAAVYFSRNSQQVFHPFLIRKIPFCSGPEQAIDLETAYGYGGPAVFSADQAFIREFSAEFSRWAAENNVVAEFVRFNPLTANHQYLSDHYQVSLNRATVSIDLQQEFSAILRQCSAPRQRNYRHAISAGLQFQQITDLAIFCQMYAKTMQRLGADPYYYFSKEAFDTLEKLPESNKFLCLVTSAGGEAVAAGVFLFDQLAAHYHLGASNPEFKHLQANAFMMLEIARIARERYLTLMHLGGGLSMQESDTLYRFKAGFSKQRHQFFIGRRIYNPSKYETLSQAWQQRTGNKPGILLHYHYGENHANI